MSKNPEKFEAALEKLEEIARRLEEGEIPLEESIKAFEEGMKLSKLCEQKLSEAQKKIEILVKKAGGRPTIKAFEGTD